MAQTRRAALKSEELWHHYLDFSSADSTSVIWPVVAQLSFAAATLFWFESMADAVSVILQSRHSGGRGCCWFPKYAVIKQR